MPLQDEAGHTPNMGSCADLSPAQRAAVIEEMDGLLDDPTFRHSKRCVALLRWVVQRALEESHTGLKERTLGVQVFGRSANYDTNADPVVRMTANEIRKRLAQYYQKPERSHNVRIRLVPGSYLPAFDFQPDGKSDIHTATPETENQEPAVPQDIDSVSREETYSELLFDEPSKSVSRVKNDQASSAKSWSLPSLFLGRKVVWSIAILAIVVAGVFAFTPSDLFRTRQYKALAPLLHSNGDLIVALSDDPTLLKSFREGTSQGQTIAEIINLRTAPKVADPATFVPTSSFGDVNVAHKISIWLAEHGKSSTLRPSSEISFVDFRHRPVVLVGYLDNAWSLILLSNMRFSARVDPATRIAWIQDAQNPNKRDWMRTEPQIGDPLVDYAVVSRFFDSETGEWILGIAGLGQRGTEAACQLLIDPAYEGALPSGVRSSNNFQIVVKTPVINGKSGPPQVLAFHAW